MSANIKPTLTVFGATGGCAGFTLAAALKAGYTCRALVRTPDKLKTSLMLKGVDEAAFNSNLTVIQGDVRDETAVTKAISVDGKEVVDIIISGIGSFPIFQWSISRPVVIKDATVCEDAARILLQSLSKLNSSKKPLVVAVSTTGIQPAGKPRDVPLAYVALYHWLLKSPHEDKLAMETIFRDALAEAAATKPISGFIAVKPTLLMDGESQGIEHIRYGTEDEPAIGYSIKRSEVAAWMFDKLILNRPDPGWLGKGVCLTA